MEQNQGDNQPIIQRPKAVFIPVNIHKRLRFYLLKHGGTIQEATGEALSDWLDRKEKEVQK